MTMHETQPNTNNPADAAAAARAAARQGAPKLQNTPPKQPEAPKVTKTTEPSPSKKGWIKVGVGAASIALVAGGAWKALSGGGESSPEPQTPVATASQDPSVTETTEPTVESQYSAEEQAALDAISAMSIDDITGDFSPEDLEISNIANTFSDPYDSPTTRGLGKQDPNFEKAFDINAYVIGAFASPEVSSAEKTELLGELGLSPSALRDALITSLKVANSELDSNYPWQLSENQEIIQRNIAEWRLYAGSFYVAVLSAIENGAEIPTVMQVASITDEIKADRNTYKRDLSQFTTNYGEQVNENTIWLLRLQDGKLIHTAEEDWAVNRASSYNAGGIKFGTSSPINVLSFYPYNPTRFVIQTYQYDEMMNQ